MKLLTQRIAAETCDITKLEVSAIVNAANSGLLGGGGVDGAIHRAGGREILEECKKIRREIYPEGMPAGNAVITTAGKMPASFVIHTVGPVWYGGKNNEDNTLRNAYLNSLKTARDRNLETIAFPAISTGVYGFPKERAAKIAFSTVAEFITENEFPKKVIFVFYKTQDEEIFLNTVAKEGLNVT